MIRCLALLALLAAPFVQADTALHDDLPLRYLEQTPAGTHDQPLVIFLHGYGSNEADLFGLYERLPATYTYLSARAPQTLDEDSFQWFRRKGQGPYDGVSEDLASSAGLIEQFVRAAAAKYHTEPGKVVLVGFSQGAVMAYEVGLRHPQSVRGIAALSGKILPQLASQLKGSAQLQRLGIFIGHGTNDQRLPYSDGAEANRLLQGLALEPQFHAYPGMGHSISEVEIQDLDRWLRGLTP
ncbi:alpha/beta hydrolase [Pseudomonas sessilinigenes]|uniref:Alpha/beta fold hydrolase n=1 Tax=Pseudomonas sessilinigenes TaxID=658629 RepID=A0ABX8MJ25_9PSED|nr:alpha/beta fold hydrolase [Pseudomonas sessilinigenes]AZC27416.1 phospholipase/carboxylesterase family protein [Pseudomonas sessilinigenes]QXH38678.1 alpha/beta fold hydrolase [Pseudomonas sessilinigenes]